MVGPQAPQAPPVPPTPWQGSPYPGYPPYPPYPPPRYDGSKIILIVVVVVVVMILVTVVLAAVLYVLVSGLIGAPDGGPQTPIVSLGSPTTCGAECWDIRVLDTTHREPLALFRVSLWIDGDPLVNPVPLAEGVVWTDDRAYLNLTDTNGDLQLSPGDAFRADHLPPATLYEFSLIWAPTFTTVATIRWGG